jgi:glycosyltransferase involved in cell wall biosynthesis
MTGGYAMEPRPAVWAPRNADGEAPKETELVGHAKFWIVSRLKSDVFVVKTGSDSVVRVIYITPGGIEGRGGMGRMARYLLAAFRTQPDVEVRVLDSYGPGPFWKMPFYFLGCLVVLFVLCARRRVDAVHVHMSFGGSTVRKLVLLRAAGLFGIATMLHLHGSEFAVFCDQLSPRLRDVLVRNMARAARIVVIGSFWRQYLVEGLGIDGRKIAVVANGVPLPDARAQPVSIDGPCRIVCLGALGRRKGTSDLLQALASPRLRELHWDAVIAGNGDVEAFRTEAAAAGLADRVTFPGWVGAKEGQALLASAGVFVLPSYNEGLPVAVLEAMASGVPVVTTMVGAIPDLRIDGEAGFLIAPGAIADLADRLATLIQDAALRAQFGTNGRRRIESEYTIGATAIRLAALYREASFQARGGEAIRRAVKTKSSGITSVRKDS